MSLKKNQQRSIKVVKNWRKEASHFKISIMEQERMARAFRIAD